MKTKIAVSISALALSALATDQIAIAAPVVTTIGAEVVSVSGNQLPTNLGVGDAVSFRYEYDDAGTEAHIYYLDGSVETIPISFYPHLLTLSDTSATFSPNVLAAFSEFHGTNGYQVSNSNWTYTDINNAGRTFQDWVSPSGLVYLSGIPTLGAGGFIGLWAADQTVTTVFLEYTEVTTSHVPEPATLALLGLGLAGLCFSRRKQ